MAGRRPVSGPGPRDAGRHLRQSHRPSAERCRPTRHRRVRQSCLRRRRPVARCCSSAGLKSAPASSRRSARSARRSRARNWLMLGLCRRTRTARLAVGEVSPAEKPVPRQVQERRRSDVLPEELLARARQEDANHRSAYQRPISADTLRKRLRIGAKRSRRLVALLRSEAQDQANRGAEDRDVASEDGIAQAAGPGDGESGSSWRWSASTTLRGSPTTTWSRTAVAHCAYADQAQRSPGRTSEPALRPPACTRKYSGPWCN